MRRRSVVAGAAAVALNLGAQGSAARSRGGARKQAVDRVVIHSTGGPTCDPTTNKPIWVGAGALAENLRNIEAHPTLGIHYMIDRDGSLRASVPEDQVAHHVFGVSERSIAVELINEGDGVDPFPEAQLAALVDLLRDMKRRRGIQRSGVLRHSDLDHAPLACDKTKRRKLDPGAAFPFEAVLDRVFHPQ